MNACGDTDPSCTVTCLGPTCNPPKMFPLPSDSPPNPNVGADGVGRDPNTGYIILDSTHAAFDFLWIADDLDYGMGLVSKVNTKPKNPPYPNGQKYGEVARYATVTCQSVAHDNSGNLVKLPGATKEGQIIGCPAGTVIPGPGGKTTTCPAAPAAGLCADGMNGCCAWSNSGPGNAPGGHQPVNLSQNRPSRTAVDFNGDVWVHNRAHQPTGLQPSVTKIANSLSDCVDRNGNGKIETSSDVNGDGIISTDCNDDNVPDDGSVTACSSGRVQEFWGLDDECILFTVNHGGATTVGGTQGDWGGRPLTLGQGSIDFSPADAWVGSWCSGDHQCTSGTGTTGGGLFYRVDGTTGLIKTTVVMQPQGGVNAYPYGAAIDQFGILWAPNEGDSHLFYFDTNNTSMQGAVASNQGGGGFYGIAIDGYKDQAGNLVQQVWLGNIGDSGIYRYRPDRSGGFATLGGGRWARALFPGPTQGRGVGVDNRGELPGASGKSFAWVALDGGAIGRVPIDLPDGPTSMAATDVFTTTQSGTLGVGVAIDYDIWGINQDSSSATHFSVDLNGNVTNAATPDIVPLDDNLNLPSSIKPLPYTYSDFTGFGLRNFTNPHGKYTWIQPGCSTGTMKAKWLKVLWDANTPAGTAITLRVRSADDMVGLPTATFFGPYTASPADLSQPPGPLLPNPSGLIQVEFDLTTTDKMSTPALKSFQIISECPISLQ
jgi:hypothetical protein